MEQGTLPQPTSDATTRETEPEVQASIASGDITPGTPLSFGTDRASSFTFGRMALWVTAAALLGFGAKRLWRR